ncbi:MAG TPA: asparagine synthase-related protein [Nitrososphaeraceae archaeon]
MLTTDKCQALRVLLTDSVKRNFSKLVLLSGGLDSSIIAGIIRPECSITVGLGDKARDFIFANRIAKRYCIKHVQVVLSYERLISIIHDLIRILKTFDPIEIRNSSVIYAGIQEARCKGYTSVMTGDGGDELFAGYNYMARYYDDLKNLDEELHRLWQIMHFSSAEIGKALGVYVKTPYLDENFISYAKSIDVSDKIGDYNGKTWGKFILRKSFETCVGKEIAWRSKLAQEEGAQTTLIKNFASVVLNDKQFEDEIEKSSLEGVKIRDKEHLYYYLIYKENFSIPKKDNKKHNLRCSECLAAFVWNGRYCRTCGSFPVVPIHIEMEK